MIKVAVKVAIGVAALLVLYVGITFWQVWHASHQDHAQPAQAIIVLGAAQYNGTPSRVLQARLDHAAELYERKLAPVIMLTGGRQPGDQFTEASAGEAYLQRAGIPESAMQLESGGRNSWQSLAAAARILKQQGLTKVILVSSPYHSYRIERIAHEVGLEGHASPATDAPDKATFAHLTHETASVAVGRLIGFRRLVDLDARVRS